MQKQRVSSVKKAEDGGTFRPPPAHSSDSTGTSVGRQIPLYKFAGSKIRSQNYPYIRINSLKPIPVLHCTSHSRTAVKLPWNASNSRAYTGDANFAAMEPAPGKTFRRRVWLWVQVCRVHTWFGTNVCWRVGCQTWRGVARHWLGSMRRSRRLQTKWYVCGGSLLLSQDFRAISSFGLLVCILYNVDIPIAHLHVLAINNADPYSSGLFRLADKF